MATLPASSASSHPAARRAFSLHDRLWQNNRYVYPVVSRRSKGISVGINLNPDKVCNFDCIYCSVDRTAPAPPNPNLHPNLHLHPVAPAIDLAILRAELESMLSLIHSGSIYSLDPFDKVPPELRRLNDIAFSGDGEPTTCPQFDAAVRLAAEVIRHSSFAIRHSPKLVLITNATMFHRPAVRETLAFLDQHNGEIWAKLDAGTDAYYHLVDRTTIPFQRVLDNLLWCCQTRPTVIQTLLMRVHGTPPSADEIAAYAARLKHITDNAGQIKLIQLYTIARTPAEAFATPLSADELNSVRARLRQVLSVPFEVYP